MSHGTADHRHHLLRGYVRIEVAMSRGALWFWSLVWIFALGVLPLGIALGIGEWVNK